MRSSFSRLRALLPSWRFFDRVAAPPELWLRLDDGPWDRLALRREPAALRWVAAPRHNLALAYHAVVERLVQELGELELDEDAAPDADGVERDPLVTSLVSYRLVARIAREAAAGAASYQWKITVTGEDYLRSEVVRR